MQRSNPFQSIYDICNRGNSRVKLLELPAFPRYINVELTNKCNFKCLMCSTGIGMVNRKKGFMSDDTFVKVLKQIKPHKTPVTLIGWGEPLLHPHIFEYIAGLKDIGTIVHINTNASLLSKKRTEDLLNTGLDSIKFSFQGVNQHSYHEMRNIDFFEQLLKIVEGIYQKRGNKEKPFIHISTTITYETSEQVKIFKERAKRYADLVTVGRTLLEHIDIEAVNLTDDEKQTLIRLKEQESVIKKHPECPEVFDKLSILWDGAVSACCGDYDNKMLVGDLKDNSLKEIWEGEQMGLYRSLLADMRHDEIELCSTCYDNFGLQMPGLQQIE